MKETLTTKELIKTLSEAENKPIYINVGYNRYCIDNIYDEGDYLEIFIDVSHINNPFPQPNDKDIA
jgi:hypothetical protein